jgi:predicted glycosyltransferase
LPIIRHLEKKHEIIITARNFSETLPLLISHGVKPIVYGEYMGKNRLLKIAGMLTRMISIYAQIPNFDISFSLGGNYTATISRLRRKPSIVFSDNDISFKNPAYKFGTDFIFPSYFNPEKIMNKYKIHADKIKVFDGFKEDIYIADYAPDPFFINHLPFKEFITIRPENLKASYVPTNSRTIVPDLFRIFENENILFLPRYEEEKSYAMGFRNVFIPDRPLPGLDVCNYTKAMMTGAGTFAREAALLGTPAVSFFPGKYLAVDEEMIKRNWEYKSRNPIQIYNYIKSCKKRTTELDRSKNVKQNVLNIIDNIMAKYN